MSIFILAWVFLIGTCIGSFINVVIYRLQSSEHHFLTKRSYCYHCHNTLAWIDLIPVLSWILLKGRCRSCQARISLRYPLVELLLGGLALVCLINISDPTEALGVFVFCAVLVAIGFIDLDSWMIPIQLPIIIAATGLLSGYFQGIDLFIARLLGLAIGFSFFAVFLVLSTWIFRQTGRLKADENAMGWGDPILIAAIGANLGWLLLAPLILLASLQAIALYGFFSWARKPLSGDDWIPPQKSLPFGPFLALAGMEIALFNSMR